MFPQFPAQASQIWVAYICCRINGRFSNFMTQNSCVNVCLIVNCQILAESVAKYKWIVAASQAMISACPSGWISIRVYRY
jgi:hypothetical protein